MTVRSLVDPGVPARGPASLRAFFELAFRPLYLAGEVAALALYLWRFAPLLIRSRS